MWGSVVEKVRRRDFFACGGAVPTAFLTREGERERGREGKLERGREGGRERGKEGEREKGREGEGGEGEREDRAMGAASVLTNGEWASLQH